MAPRPVLLVLAAAALLAAARDVPAHLARFYQAVRARRQCVHVLAGGFHSKIGDAGDTAYCGDHLRDSNVLYLQGTHGRLANMDIDCDGTPHSPAADGRCALSATTLPQTSFRHLVQAYDPRTPDLDASAHPFVVFGNAGAKPGWRTFDPRAYGVEPLSLMAVVCNNSLVYGVWGDINGDHGPVPVVGEASLALATACFGTAVSGAVGHDDNDVLYLAFPGPDAVPGPTGARWNATNYSDFEASIAALGYTLIRRIGDGGRDSLVCKGGKCDK